MVLCTVLIGLFVTIHAQSDVVSKDGDANLARRINAQNNSFFRGYDLSDLLRSLNALSRGIPQIGVFEPDWRYNLTRNITEDAKDSISKHSGISTVFGITTVNAHIGGRRYSAQIPPNSSVSLQSHYNSYYGQEEEEVMIAINGDTTVYKTVNGTTVVTDGDGNIRPDGGPFHINSDQGRRYRQRYY